MRIRLPESERTRARRPGAALTSVVLHGALIALAMNAAVREPRAEPAPDAEPVLIYRAPPAPAPPVARQPVGRAGAPAGPAAPPGAPILPPDARIPDVALPGPIAVDLALPGAAVGRRSFDDRAIGAIGAVGAPTARPGGAPLDAHQVERAAAPLREIRPRYPDALRARGADGAVLARYVVDDGGRVPASSIEIVEATDSLLATAVRAALRDARFRPAEVGGRAVAQLVEQRFLFALRDR